MPCRDRPMCQSEVCSSRMAGTYVGVPTEPHRLAVTDRSHSAGGPGSVTPAPCGRVVDRCVSTSSCGSRVPPPSSQPWSPRMYSALSCARRSASSSTMWLSSCWTPSLSGIRRSTVAPPSPGRLDAERAGVDDPLPQRLRVRDVGDPRQPEVAAAAGQDALAEQQPVRGDHVVRRPPAQQRHRDDGQQQEDGEREDEHAGGAPAAARPGSPPSRTRPRRRSAGSRTTGQKTVSQCGCRCWTTSSSSASSLSG